MNELTLLGEGPPGAGPGFCEGVSAWFRSTRVQPQRFFFPKLNMSKTCFFVHERGVGPPWPSNLCTGYIYHNFLVTRNKLYTLLIHSDYVVD